MYKKLASFILAFALTACVQTGLPPEQRPQTWAQPVNALGIPNLHEITPHLFRSAQPDFEGLVVLNNMKKLSSQPEAIRTVLSLRSMHSDEDIYPSRNVHYVSVPMDTWAIKEQDVIQALRIINTPQMQPVLLHCQHGADRTGLISALYRVLYQGWTKEEAIREMTLGSFGFHGMWQNLIDYINNVNVSELRHKVDGMGEYPEPAFKY
ncbi:tyrosine-protein phosphatase [Hydromonas duriensis]|uniref:Protein tyrosine/serine phosphatase n=1 Tax=Hydromonas duriensis TaxID=1527608 RepID=A0A4R6Y6X0_9BURK|nr:tyrosine-protein phosphatase [Hydromonas duriensis]TDR29018.1 protein tyrosine/serine phosphatase [Hydromonas duriensis]